jgi:hypothetical protein
MTGPRIQPFAVDLQLQDRLEILELYQRYALAYDEVDVDLLRTCFSSAANFTCGVPDHPLLQGFDEIAARMLARHEDREFVERHITTNVVVRTADADRATASAEAAIFVTPHGGMAELEMTGRYDDELVREKGRWVFSRRSFKPDGPPRDIS